MKRLVNRGLASSISIESLTRNRFITRESRLNFFAFNCLRESTLSMVLNDNAENSSKEINLLITS